MGRFTKRHFWEWFRKNNGEYLDLNNKGKKETAYWINEFHAHLRAYCRSISFNLTVYEKNTAALTITALGRATRFKTIDALVALAPEVPGWTITALEPPMPAAYGLEEQLIAAGIEVSELYFSFYRNIRGETGIVVYHPLCTEENRAAFLHLAQGVVYNLLGERSFGLDIPFLKVANLSHAGDADIKKLEELPAGLDQRLSPLVVNGAGILSGL